MFQEIFNPYLNSQNGRMTSIVACRITLCILKSMCEKEKSTENLKDNEEKRPKFGNRYLTNETEVFTHNAWDHVEWNEEQERMAAEAVAKNSTLKMNAIDVEKFQNNAHQFWNTFYGTHENRFFKDRHWLFTEFPELAPAENSTIKEQQQNIFELGCGVGNTLLPILKYNQNDKLHVYGCDFSQRAIEIFSNHADFDKKRCNVFVMDATLNDWSHIVPFAENSMDIIVLIFVLSAIEPSKMKTVADNCYRYLRPGGLILFRDYGRYDLAQLRFKSGKCLQDNLYVRGDGTMVYFFTLDEVRQLFVNAGFEAEQTVVDRRLQVNRVRLLKMYRVWIQTKFKKPFTS